MDRTVFNAERSKGAATAFALLALSALAAAGAAGWIRHGEAIWLAMAQGAWTTCF